MIKRKSIRSRGKVQLSAFFQQFKPGDSVALVREMSFPPQFPKRMQGKTGVIVEQRGKSYVVKVKDFNLPKQYIVAPIHLRQIKGEAQ